MRPILAIASLLLMFIASAAEAASLSVALQPARTSIVGNADIVLKIVIRNAGAAAVTVPIWQVPSDDIPAPVLRVTAADGAPARYIGPLIKWSPEALKSGVTFPPNSSRTFTIELSALYDIGNGRYRIEYAQDNAGGSSPGSTRAAGFAPGAPVYIDVQGRSRRSPAPAVQSQTPSSPSLTTQLCSTAQQAAISTAISNALSYAQNGKNYFTAKGAYTAAGSRYLTWFGAANATRWAIAQSHFANIQDALSSRPVSADCSCRKRDVYAYVYPDQPYLIYLCKAFWTAPPTGTDSKAGTLIHELSHFTIVAGTSDYAYGQSDARSLALRNPARAVRNADNHEYFAENTPPLN